MRGPAEMAHPSREPSGYPGGPRGDGRLTMDVFTPRRDANGAGVVLVVSGGFFSAHEAINPASFKPLIDRGYTVFAVVHGSQPRYTVDEITARIRNRTGGRSTWA